MNEKNTHTRLTITRKPSRYVSTFFSTILALVKRIAGPTINDVSQSCESQPSPKTYAMNWFNLLSKTCIGASLYSTRSGTHRRMKAMNNNMKTRTAFACTVSRVRQAMYMLTNIPKTSGNNSRLDTESHYSKSDKACLMGFLAVVVGIAVSENRLAASFAFAVALVSFCLMLIWDLKQDLPQFLMHIRRARRGAKIFGQDTPSNIISTTRPFFLCKFLQQVNISFASVNDGL